MRYRQVKSYLASSSKIFQTLYIKIQAQIAFNRSDVSPNNQRQIYKDFGIETIFFVWFLKAFFFGSQFCGPQVCVLKDTTKMADEKKSWPLLTWGQNPMSLESRPY